MIEHPKRSLVKIFGALSIIAVFAIAVGWVFWSIWWPFHVWDIKPHSFRVLNDAAMVQRGDKLHLSINYCEYMDVKTQIDVAVLSGRPWTLEPIEFHAQRGCHSDVISIEIPATLPLETTTAYTDLNGVATLRIEFSHKINALRTVEEKFVSEKFVIVP